MKKFVDISAFKINYANRGNSALCYGTISFLLERKLLSPGQTIINFKYYRNPFRTKSLHAHKEHIKIAGHDWTYISLPVNGIEKWLLMKFGILLPFTKYRYYIKNLAYEAAAYGGDGFSDIYGDILFKSRLGQTLPLMKAKVPLIILPQTIGPFQKESNHNLANNVLKYADRIFVRDSNYVDELKNMHLDFELTKDLSYFMQPDELEIDIPQKSIGINVSGLAYSNKFHGLEGQFDAYPALIDRIICHFREIGYTIFLIPHSYQYGNPEPNNDDYIACKEAYSRLKNKEGVVFVDNNLTSPQVKYVISKMSFFIGTRMHANFAAIYTNVPVFGLAYSYKFKGAFNANGLDGDKQTAMINNIKEDDIDIIIKKVEDFFISIK